MSIWELKILEIYESQILKRPTIKLIHMRLPTGIQQKYFLTKVNVSYLWTSICYLLKPPLPIYLLNQNIRGSIRAILN